MSMLVNPFRFRSEVVSSGEVSSGEMSSGGEVSSGEIDTGGAGAKASQAVVLAAVDAERDARVSQAAVLAAIEPTPPPERVSQGLVLVAGEIVPDVPISQACVLVLVEQQPCATGRCQLWTITRKDGREFLFTSLDEDVTYGGELYLKCNSLMASAAESASAVGSVGSVDLSGIIADDAITEEDIYGGLFDDAEVEVWLVAWDGEPFVPVRLAAGNMGQVSQGEQGFKSEVVGPGARLGQQSVVQVVSPNCSWKFGDPATCKVDREAMAISGVVLRGYDRGLFTADLSDGSTGPQWANGVVRWTGGKNAGREDEIKTVAFAEQTIQLWSLAAFVPDYGDTFDMLPGCDLLKTGGCTVYDNFINFGGFDIPGDDSLMQVPDAQY